MRGRHDKSNDERFMSSLNLDAALERLPVDMDRDLLVSFIVEGGDCVSHSEVALLQLETNPDDLEAINTVFRAFHTVKGTSAFLELPRITEFAHEAESLLSRVRDRQVAYGGHCAELSFRSVDMLRELLRSVERALEGDGSIVLPGGYDALKQAVAGYDPSLESGGFSDAELPIDGAGDRPTHASLGTPGSTVDGARADLLQADRGESTIRVRTDRLDRLFDMVGELVIAQSLILGEDRSETTVSNDLEAKLTHAGKIARELQNLAMSLRMVPLRPVFQKLTRVVRDTASKAGKPVRFIAEGEDLEMDRHLVDHLVDPLVHMIRNAIDHGVESPQERLACGKVPTGVVRLCASQARGGILLELRDDGRGLHRERIVAKALANGLITSDQDLSDAEVFRLIFAPGFSTAQQVTDLSGRGVGMDVVLRHLEDIRGQIDISSSPGVGTTFAMHLPLTLAVTDGMLARVGAERFIIPLAQLELGFRPEASCLSIDERGVEQVLLGEELMPVVRLHRLFDVPTAVQSPLDGLLVVVRGADRRVALLVDDLFGPHQFVAKPLGVALGRVPGISSGSILGNGQVGLILDIHDTLALARADNESAWHRAA